MLLPNNYFRFHDFQPNLCAQQRESILRWWHSFSVAVAKTALVASPQGQTQIIRKAGLEKFLKIRPPPPNGVSPLSDSKSTLARSLLKGLTWEIKAGRGTVAINTSLVGKNSAQSRKNQRRHNPPPQYWCLASREYLSPKLTIHL